MTSILTCEEYDRYRHNIEHEDELINHRLTWLLISQSFLFGACVAAGSVPFALRVASVVLCLCVYMSIIAAIRSISFLRAEVDGRAPSNCPPIVGADKSHTFGLVAPLGIPIVLILGWLSL